MPRSTLDGLMVKVNCTSFLAVDVPGEGRKVLITPFGDLGDGSFLDPVGNQRLFIDHGKQVCTGAEALSGSEYRDSSGLRDDVDSAMNRYAANKLPNFEFAPQSATLRRAMPKNGTHVGRTQ